MDKRVRSWSYGCITIHRSIARKLEVHKVCKNSHNQDSLPTYVGSRLAPRDLAGELLEADGGDRLRDGDIS